MRRLTGGLLFFLHDGLLPDGVFIDNEDAGADGVGLRPLLLFLLALVVGSGLILFEVLFERGGRGRHFLLCVGL